MKIRALIVDDEPLARQRIRQLAAEHPDLAFHDDCEDGPEALATINSQPPDLIFLDIKMPGMSGFDLLAQLPADRMPQVIFSTAYDEHAIRAFDAHALDYLLKPIQQERFDLAVGRARERLSDQREAEAAKGILNLLQDRSQPTSAPPPRISKLTIKSDEKVEIIPIADIDHIESAGNYVAVHASGQTHIMRETLNALEDQLDPAKFLRVSRSAIVNLDRIKELQPLFKGEHVLILKSGTRLTVKRGIRELEHAIRFS